MNVIRAYKFRLYPNSKCQSEINLQLRLSKDFYNKLLEKAKEDYGKDKSFKPKRSAFNKIKKEVIAENKDFLKIYSQTRCEIEDRVIKAYRNFFRRCGEKKKGKNVKAGFPRFKSRERYYSIIYPQDNGSFSIEKKQKITMLRVSRIGRVQIEQHRTINGKIKTMTIKKEGREYHAIFTAEQETETKKIEDTNPVGIDMGINNFIALSDGQTIQKPKFFKEKEKRIARWQRIVERRTIRKGKKMASKQSRRREKAKDRLQNEWNDVARKSNDFMHKLSDNLIHGGYTSFAVEELNIQNMVKNRRLAQSIQNASWNRFINMLSYKAESAGMGVIKVDARNTSKTCSNCGNITDMPLSAREYNCDRCGLRLDWDINASINILNRATLGQRESHAQGDITSTIQQELKSCIKELRTDKTNPLQNTMIA